MKVKVIKRFHDMEQKKIQEVKIQKNGKKTDNILEVSDERAAWLVKNKMVVIVEDEAKTGKTAKAEGKE